MKKALAGGFLALTGSIWFFAILYTAGNNLVTSWDAGLGRFWTTVTELRLVLLFVLSVVFTVLGIILMAVECFRKEK